MEGRHPSATIWLAALSCVFLCLVGALMGCDARLGWRACSFLLC